jgi:hypothetical protein
MTGTYLPFSNLTTICAAASLLAGCVLDPKSTGDLDEMSETTADLDQDTGDTDADGASGTSSAPGDETGGGSDGPLEPGDPPDVDCDVDCATPAVSDWSRVVSTDSATTWACDVAIDSTGRVALAWHVESAPGLPLGRTGIDVMAPDGMVVGSTAVEGEIYGSLAFTSDGTLRLRGATVLGGNEYQEWTRALDADLEPTWSDDYHEQRGWGQCGWGSRAVVVDSTDHVVTYEYICSSEGNCPQGFVRRHAPDGTLMWEHNPGGNPGILAKPIAAGVGQSMFHGAVLSYDDHDETHVRKYSAGGMVEWMTIVPGEIGGIWGTSDGGVYVFTHDFYTSGTAVHRLGSQGEYLWVAPGANDGLLRIIGPTANETGFFALATDGLRRVTPALETIWSSPIQHAEQGWSSASAVFDDEVFAIAGSNTEGEHNYWVSVLTKP